MYQYILTDLYENDGNYGTFYSKLSKAEIEKLVYNYKETASEDYDYDGLVEYLTLKDSSIQFVGTPTEILF